MTHDPLAAAVDDAYTNLRNTVHALQAIPDLDERRYRAELELGRNWIRIMGAVFREQVETVLQHIEENPP